MWDIRNSSAPVFNLTGHSQDVTDCCLWSGGEGEEAGMGRCKILSASKDGSIGLWDAGEIITIVCSPPSI